MLIAWPCAGDGSFDFLPYQVKIGSIPEREPEKRLPHPRKAAGAQITQSQFGEDLLEGKSGASSRGNSSSKSFALVMALTFGTVWLASVETIVMMNRNGWGDLYLVARGEILGLTEDKLLRRHFTQDVFIDQGRKLGDRRRLDTVVVLTANYAD
ncbi:hypothetical protein PHYBLDRAFT_147286 [Phycomyces blakesleeanus NRRL 1555(-)]|uniref:Uncharacterized protein n=2 Tax=Phycomyces blakesleeanus TaxID=4837 RepID=A0A162TTW4_PHYB8|nr:hypothetical protein PHYBLDRAFT_153824 [Phycomyces blakesleeanus NRRL 1555(-)]XP_018289002.1 hypothetical protein PHYBLDRAFT_148179 [Phycomyces blakesleeanus NRRL 1555(-)]XP_018289008.1 hypothetical protein PHYBLDRAFT_148183 [Phycomyces blakesleeanus NRRL 1555(-)]XP_018289018.1 hypothetical protein PHYBLDRAFT_148188 [Phycomyces blakesleeanus NRRL 1555(-)]XP_018289579.1 hypothetical protein PHYBLDRAFT_147286 [Phycomyces blakesleeanus NRRL 1555(-)]OAD65070.1 hypothetical protein PHYBLDRAFT_15|eukprot:XP_018283110.1 hypothetical protein PHYBLDRAFT_153824 [Phycomyces blakesleeanus NRRL 1555(-)]